MRITSSPTMAQVAQLLGVCGLPSEDIQPEYLSNFFIAQDAEQDVGVAGLQILGENVLVRSVGVHPGHRSHGIAAHLLSAVEERARSLGAKRLYLLTNDAQAFFARHGYVEVPRCSAPAEVQGSSQFGSSCCGAATLMLKSTEA